MTSCFFFNDTATTEIYTLSLHDALPDDLEQLLAQREARHEADARQRHAEPRALGGHAQVAVQGQLAAAGDGVAVDQRDRGMARALDLAQDRHDLHLRPAVLHLAQVA